MITALASLGFLLEELAEPGVDDRLDEKPAIPGLPKLGLGSGPRNCGFAKLERRSLRSGPSRTSLAGEVSLLLLEQAVVARAYLFRRARQRRAEARHVRAHPHAC